MSSNTRGGDEPDAVTPHFKFGYVRFDENPSMNRELFSLRFKVYCLECGFLDPKEYADELETDEFDNRSVHFTAHNLENELVGSVRLVLPAFEERFPFEDHCLELFADGFRPPRQQSGEVSRLVVKQNYRRRVGDTAAGVAKEFLISNNFRVGEDRPPGERRSKSPQILLGLYRGMYQFSVETNIRYWYAAMERSLARALDRLQFTFHPIGRETNYYGPVTPYLADLRDLERKLAERNPDLLEWFQLGL
jgi:N-acyl amino acid synthase of PEP-CTERM/exosortase system